MHRVTLLVVVSLLAVVLGEVIEFKKCGNETENVCTVSEVRMTPCKNLKKCKLKKGKVQAISFDFVPNFSSSNIASEVFWANDAMDVPFDQLKDADGCKYTTCPTEAGKSQVLNYSLRIGKKLPSGNFLIKWKVTNRDNRAQFCCFLSNIEIK